MDKIIRLVQPPIPQIVKRKRVAAYARVSSGKDAALHSLSAQVSYYNSYIQKHNDWIFAGVYADEALSGTKNSRPEFQRLLSDCRAGKVDLIIAKSISRFARNVLTLLETVRELKGLGIDVFFEKENIHSVSNEGELILTILASYAQEESRSVSENCRWHIQKMFEKGKPNNGTLLGYRIRDGVYQIVPEEAAVVKMIYADYLSGMGRVQIMRKLNSLGIKTRLGNVWNESSVEQILHDEKYTGNMKLQKTFKPDYMSKHNQINRGERYIYSIEGSHEAIISQEDYTSVQEEIRRRAERYNLSSKKQKYPFTSKIKCGNCGKYYRRKVLHNHGKTTVTWQCSTYLLNGREACPAKQIPEETLMSASAELLGLQKFDKAVFESKVRQITVTGPNDLEYEFVNGSKSKYTWQDASRRDSWTEEMRSQAREKAYQRRISRC